MQESSMGGMIMRRYSAQFRALALVFFSILWLTGVARAAELRVMISGGLTAAYKELVPNFERLTGHTVITSYGPSMGTTVNAIPVRLGRVNRAVVLVMVGYALDDPARKGRVVPDSHTDLVKSPIGIAVKA